jgi:MFS family permease
MGMILGRLIGSPLVNKGRFRCIIISSIVMIIGISFMLILNIYSFLFGRLIYGLGAGLFFASGPRYIEECSPPQLFSLLYTFYALGVALNRPILMVSALIIPEKV